MKYKPTSSDKLMIVIAISFAFGFLEAVLTNTFIVTLFMILAFIIGINMNKILGWINK